MNEFVKMSAEINELAKALTKAQSEFKPVEKNGFNPYFNSKFSTLGDVENASKEALAKHGLSLIQFPSAGSSQGQIGITTLLIHSSGQWISGTVYFYAKDSSPQAMGSCITYARRYTKAAALGLTSEEDDDGNHASKTSDSPQNRNLGPSSSTASLGGAYVVPFGKYKGKALSELTPDDIESYVKFLSNPKDGKAPSGNAATFIAEARRYLSGPSKSEPARDDLPDFSDEDIPF